MHLLVLFFRLICVKCLSRNMTRMLDPGRTNLSTWKLYCSVQTIFSDIMKSFFFPFFFFTVLERDQAHITSWHTLSVHFRLCNSLGRSFGPWDV